MQVKEPGCQTHCWLLNCLPCLPASQWLSADSPGLQCILCYQLGFPDVVLEVHNLGKFRNVSKFKCDIYLRYWFLCPGFLTVWTFLLRYISTANANKPRMGSSFLWCPSFMYQRMNDGAGSPEVRVEECLGRGRRELSAPMQSSTGRRGGRTARYPGVLLGKEIARIQNREGCRGG